MNLIEDIFTRSYVFEILQAVLLVAHITRIFHSYSCMVSCKYNNVDAVTEKVHHVTSNAECARRYGSQMNSKMVSVEVIEPLNKPMDTGRRSWNVRS